MKSITLVGFMGAGKTSAGKELARLLDIPFLDLDAEIARHEGKSVNDIFFEHGERYFRSKEWEVLVKLERGDRVLSIGGGAYTIDDNVDLINSRSRVIWLDCPLPICIERCAKDGANRPLFKDPTQMAQLYNHRIPYYRKAKYKVNSGQGGPSEIAEKMISVLGLSNEVKK